MTAQIALTLGSIGAAVALYAAERLCVDVIALLVLLALALGGLVSPGEVFAGFASPAIIASWTTPAPAACSIWSS